MQEVHHAVPTAAAFIHKDFYVDDGMKSIPTAQEMISLINTTQGVSANAGLKLHKITSNENEVIEAIPVEERAKGVNDINLETDPLPVEIALGITWCLPNDSFQDRLFTRRGILSFFGKVERRELHHFSDAGASEGGYGQFSYLKQVNEQGKAHCALVIGKAQVTPIKLVTMHRLELTAATDSAKMSEFLKTELSFENIAEFFWTDSKIMLGYVNSDAKRFQVFVANRVQ
ncbi:Hypothetical predicted protein [Paramuricea clavata]|uniref:Uncharacterized protein n=1 Tax=Paramuricea clavata TaxID=317549 RepID=A0A6S7J0S6_PARCT|nr:Hypothetical predicted protein [Paramuricea clavata]